MCEAYQYWQLDQEMEDWTKIPEDFNIVRETLGFTEYDIMGSFEARPKEPIFVWVLKDGRILKDDGFETHDYIPMM